jgi:hypothetical protein
MQTLASNKGKQQLKLYRFVLNFKFIGRNGKTKDSREL